MSVKTRFAPSPTGMLHIGNARPALINWLYAMQNSGTFLLRYDDTDKERSRQEYADAIDSDLTWLGIKPHETARQSERVTAYDEAAEKLKAAGLLYPCYETPDQLDRQRKRLQARGRPPIYDRLALKLGEEEKRDLENQGKRPHWRFLLPNFTDDPLKTSRTEITWQDLVRGEQTVDLASMSDPVLIREDDTYLYTLPSVVDDIDLGITHVLRGDDHVTNTGAQITIFQALGGPVPAFGHHNLLTTDSGEGLSKRKGSLSLESLREQGFEAGAVASLAVLTGTSGPVEPCDSLEKLSKCFKLTSVTKSAAKFNTEELAALNRRLVHELPFSAVRERLEEMDAPANEAYWLAVRPNLERVSDAAQLWSMIEHATPQVADEDRSYITFAADHLPNDPWDNETWKTWTMGLKESTGRKGKSLFMPLRKALTGQEHGPDMADLLPLIGRERTLARLS